MFSIFLAWLWIRNFVHVPCDMVRFPGQLFLRGKVSVLYMFFTSAGRQCVGVNGSIEALADAGTKPSTRTDVDCLCPDSVQLYAESAQQRFSERVREIV